MPDTDKNQTAIFAAGCFWGVEKIFYETEGVIETMVGYIGGRTPNPSYEDVCTDRTGHAEAVQIIFDPEKISYGQLLDIFWKIHDPTTPNRQGPDVGSQYRSAIFYQNQKQKEIAEISKAALEKSDEYKNPIVTEISSAQTFWKAEEYHQKYFQKNPGFTCHI